MVGNPIGKSESETERERERGQNLQATAYAADLPFGNGPVNLGGVAGAAGPKTWIFNVLGLVWPPETLGGPKLYVLSRSAPF